MPDVTSLLAASLLVPDPAARLAFEQAVSSRTALRVQLAENPALTETTWFALFKRPSLPLALALTARPLSERMRAHVLKHEVRERPLTAMVENNDLGDDEIEKIVRLKACSPKLATLLSTQIGARNPGLSRELAFKAGGITLLEWMASASDLDASAAADLIRTFPSWAPKKSFAARATLLTEVLERFPSALPAFVEPGQDSSVLTAAAGSRLLQDKALQRRCAGIGLDLGPVSIEDRKYTLLALVNNPVVGNDVLDEVASMLGSRLSEVTTSISARKAKKLGSVTGSYARVTDPDALKWLLRRALPSDYKPLGRPFECAELALNPTLSGRDRRDLAAALSRPLLHDAVGATRTRRAFDALTASDPSLEEYRPAYDVPLAHRESPTEDPSELDQVLAMPASPTAREQALASSADRLRWFTQSSWLALGIELGDRLGTSVESYDMLLGLVDEFDGTLGELVAVSSSL